MEQKRLNHKKSSKKVNKLDSSTHLEYGFLIIMDFFMLFLYEKSIIFEKYRLFSKFFLF